MTGDVNDVMPGSDGPGFLGFKKEAVSWDPSLGEASCVLWGARVRVGWVTELRADDGRTVGIVEIVYLSPRVENLNLK